jgi:hypothetical protein
MITRLGVVSAKALARKAGTKSRVSVNVIRSCFNAGNLSR